MTKFIGFFIFATWTGMSVLAGYTLSKAKTPEPAQVAQNSCPEPKEKVVFLVPYPDPVEQEYEGYDEDDDYYDEDYEDACGEDIDLRNLKPRVVVKESKKKNNKQVMLGIQSSGNFEARYNHPVSNNWGVYVGADTDKHFSIGASYSF